MEQIYAQVEQMDHGCGINIFGGFLTEIMSKKEWGPWHKENYCRGDLKLETITPHEEGAGYAIAAFIDNEVCKEAYEILKKRFKILYQSPVRVNSNTDNDFYFCVYDTKEEE